MNQHAPYDPENQKASGREPNADRDTRKSPETTETQPNPPSQEANAPRDDIPPADAYIPDDAGYSYTPPHSDEGQQYTNPDGSHGFIYNSDAGQQESGRRYRSAVIVLSVVLAAFVLGAACLVGAYLATQTLRKDDAPAEDTHGNVETSGGLVIDDNDDTESDENRAEESDTTQNLSGNSPNHSQTSRDPASAIDSIQKLPAKRRDTNGDGKAEIETDEQGSVLTSAGGDALSVATVVHRVAASVVEITTETIVQSGFLGQYISSGAGSGVVISSEGYVVTNHHVIEGANSITVRMVDGTEFPAVLVGTDEQTDVAVLWINSGEYPLTVATLGSSFDLVVGEDILAIGNPLGSLGGTVTEGMISATAREISVSGMNMTLLQVSAPINPGNSGGGLFNLAGELVGVVNAKMSSEEIEGLGFAIPIDTAYEIILEIIEYGYVRGRPALGFNVVDGSTFFDTYVYVYDERHDVVRYGDIILTADGIQVKSVSVLEAVVRTKKVGDTLELLIQRDNRQMTVRVTLVEDKPQK